MPAILRLLLAALLGLAAARLGRGAIYPPALQDRAPEILELRVERIMRLEQPGRIIFRARVLAVRRSATGVRVGDSILVRYDWDPADIERRRAQWDSRLPPAGPQFFYEPDPPAAGATIPAYLELGGIPKEANVPRAFEPAARQYSFAPWP